jgi:hypothetical protein
MRSHTKATGTKSCDPANRFVSNSSSVMRRSLVLTSTIGAPDDRRHELMSRTQQIDRCGLLVAGCTALVFLAPSFARSAGVSEPPGPLLQIKQDFATDPHWEGFNNRVVSDNGPTVHQNFGWHATPHGGEISGTIGRSRTPAYYAKKVGPFSFDDELSASGTLTLPPTNRIDGFYFGFFNSARQEWRPWSSLAVRVGEIRWANPLQSEVIVDYMSQTWKAAGYNAARILVDGKPHRWRFSYEPNVSVPTEWTDTKLRDYLGTARKTEAEIFKLADAAEPGITLGKLRERLQAANKRGQIVYQERRGTGWEVRKNADRYQGRILFQLDDGTEQPHFLDKAIRNEPARFDRFGVFNLQLPGGATEFALADLKLNGKRVDLATDPNWDSAGNHRKFIERDFHARQDFGFSRTNFAGKADGEIGGTFWRTEPIDPLHAFYADDVGQLTLDDPISFSGQIAFTAGGTDAGMMFGYFSKKDSLVDLTDPVSGSPQPQTMVLAIEGPTRIGYNFSAQLTPTRALSSHSDGPIFVPDGVKHSFSFQYDPHANRNVGRITIKLDNDVRTLDLTPKQRTAGATFDRFGLLNIRRGGKYVTVYLDDLTYTARHPRDYRSKSYEQSVVHVPYPPNGRRY